MTARQDSAGLLVVSVPLGGTGVQGVSGVGAWVQHPQIKLLPGLTPQRCSQPSPGEVQGGFCRGRIHREEEEEED